MTRTLIVIAALLVGAWAIYIFNRLISLRVRAANAWSDIDVQLRRRADLIPRLVETVRGYAVHEKRTLDQVVEARGRAASAESVAERGEAEAELSRGTTRLVALAEAYPDLKADGLFRSLHEQLIDAE